MASDKQPDLELGDFDALPAYESLSTDSNIPDLPSPHATAEVVSEYLVQILQAKDLEAKDAQRFAALWRVGTRAELRSYTLQTWRIIFGLDDEDLWKTWVAVRTEIYRKDQEARLSRRAALFLLAVCLVLTSATVVVLCLADDSLGSNDSFGWAFAAFWMLLLGGLGCVVSICSDKDPEHIAEKQLLDRQIARPKTAMCGGGG